MEKRNIWKIMIGGIYQFIINIKNIRNINNKKNIINYSIKKPINPKRDKYFIFIKYILLLLFYNNLLYNNFKKKVNSSEIIESNYYDKFEKIKLRYINNSKLKPYLDEIKIVSHIYNKNYKINKKNKINVNICVSLNNIYVYSTLVSIESIMFNCNKKKSFITCHILCTPDIKENTLFILKSLIYQYPLNLEIIIYNMGNNFMNYNNPKLSQATYYRLLSPIIFDLNRIIYLDGDTLTFKDLSEMYQIEMKDNYVYGILDFFAYGIDYLGIKSEKYINAGVIILNLETIRKDNKIYDLINVIERKIILNNQDQTLINLVFYPKIGIIPSKYVIFNHFDETDISIYLKTLRTKINFTEIVSSLKDPTIVHTCLCWPKMWSINSRYQESFSNCKHRNNCSCKKYYKFFYYYAKKTNYYRKIIKMNEKIG